MDERTRDIIDYTILAASVVGMMVAITGEILGWWADLGIVLTLASFAGTLVAIIDVYGRRGVEGIQAVRRSLQTMVRNQTGMLGNQEAMLGNQEAMLGNQDASMRKLDRIQDTLDTRLPDGG